MIGYRPKNVMRDSTENKHNFPDLNRCNKRFKTVLLSTIKIVSCHLISLSMYRQAPFFFFTILVFIENRYFYIVCTDHSFPYPDSP